MSETQSTFKTIADAQTETTDDIPEMPTVRRSEVAQVMPTPGVECFGDWAEWEAVTDLVRDGIVAAINGDQ
ncbi:hypothetical protein [Saliphagus sp. LR7]|uniref:hypothetical protein n=1 Tax=Saliphagus sp. LR7 TaxID=2282654 RepID=UPI000DF739F7|nr:hypothetical protein [Saliphagus sp. LR7]